MIKSFKKLLNSDGFTYIEVFVVLLILSLIGTLIITNQGKVLRTVSSSKERVIEKYEILTLRNILREEAGYIRPPWFSGLIPLEISSETIKIYYYKGDREDYLKIDTHRGIRISNSNREIVYFKNLKGEFTVTNSYLTYSYKDYSFIFNFGVLLG